MHYACEFGQFEVVKFLLENSNEKGIDISKKNNGFQTAEFFARDKGHQEILELFEVWTLPKKIEAHNVYIANYKSRLETLKRKYHYTEEDLAKDSKHPKV